MRLAFSAFPAFTTCAALGLSLLAPPRAAAAGPAGAPTLELTERERRAVRGAPTSESLISESPELREVRRFEEAAFPRPGEGAMPVARGPGPGAPPAGSAPGAPPAGASPVVPPGLPGQWPGSGDPTAESPAPAATTTTSSEWLRALATPEIEVRWEPQVLRYLEFFRHDPKGRAIMTTWLRRLGRFDAVFTRVFEREGLPRDLIYLGMVESGLEPGAVSRVGAGGIWQFMPAVAKAYGLDVGYWVDGRRDPERAAEAAARYLKDLHFRFGSWHLAFAAYNAGYGAISKAITRYNTNDFWELSRHEAGLPWETSLYVPKILAAAIIGHNRAAFGFGHVTAEPALAFERAEAPPATTLATIAKAAGVPVETVQALNPELVRDRTPPDRGPVPVRVPVGAAGPCVAALEALRGTTAADQVEPVALRFGETIDDVARARGLVPRELRRLNNLRDSNEVRGGTTIVVPTRATAVALEPPVQADAGAGASPLDDTTLVAIPARAFAYEDRDRIFYRTRGGDTLEEVAAVFGVAADDVIEWNNLDPAAKLHGRMVLQLYCRKNFDARGIALLDPAKVRLVTLGSEEFLALEAARRGKTRLSYTARPGDTLAKIARRYGLQPGDLARINRLSWAAELSEGQRIVVYSPTPEMPREVSVGRAAVAKHRPVKATPPRASARPPIAAKPGRTGTLATARPAAGRAVSPTKSAKPLAPKR